MSATTLSTLDALERAALLLGQGNDDGALFDVVLSGIAQTTGASRVVLYLVDAGEGELLELASVDEAAYASIDDIGRPLSFIAEKALAEGQAQFDDVDTLQPALALPLLSPSGVIGLIYADQLSRILKDKDLPGLQALANLAAAALERANLLSSLDEAEQARRDFVSLTTHEIRVPLTSISGYTDLMLSGIAGEFNERQEEFMRTVRRNVGRLTVLINDLGDLNRIQDGRMPLVLDGFELNALIDLVLREQAHAISERGHELTVRMSDGLPLAYGDQLSIKRILEKLLANAIRYTPEGGSLIVGVVQLDDRLQVTVADSGIGISRVDQARLFEPFFRSEAEAVREFTGWGLSLALAKALLEAQDGQLRYESEPGAGSVFHFTLPIAGNGLARPAPSSSLPSM